MSGVDGGQKISRLPLNYTIVYLYCIIFYCCICVPYISLNFCIHCIALYHVVVYCVVFFDCIVLCCIVPCPWLTQSALVVQDDGVHRVWWRIVLHCAVLCGIVPCPWLTHSGLVVDEDDGVHKVWRRVVQDAVYWPQQHWPGLVVEDDHHSAGRESLWVPDILAAET